MAYERLMDDLEDEQAEALHAIVTGSVSIIFTLGGKATIRGTGGATALVAKVSGECEHTAEILVHEKVVDLIENAHADMTKLLMGQRRKFEEKSHAAQPRVTQRPMEVKEFVGQVENVLGAIARQAEKDEKNATPLDVRMHIVQVVRRHAVGVFVSLAEISKAVTHASSEAQRGPTYREIKEEMFSVLGEPLPEFFSVQPGFQYPDNPGSLIGARRIR